MDAVERGSGGALVLAQRLPNVADAAAFERAGLEKRALDWAFLGSPLLTIGLPFVAKDPPLIWCANLALLIGCYGFSFAAGEAAEPEAESAGAGKIANALKALDFGSGRERGMRSYQREKYEEKQQQGGGEAADAPAADKKATPVE